MTDYISREAVIEFIRSYRCSTDVAFHMEEHLNEIPAADVVERASGIVGEIPNVELREVKRGKWEYTEMNYDDYAWVCSVCGETWVLNDGTPAENNMNYCPNCGADMRPQPPKEDEIS